MKVYRYAIAMAILLQPGHVEASSTNPIAPPALLSSSDPAAARTPAAPQDPSAAADAFATELKLRPDQKAAYDAWLASGAPDPAAQAADAAERERALDSMPHFHAYMQAHMMRDLEYARRQGAAIDALYAVLTLEQRAIFNKTMLTQMQGALAPPTVPPDAEANAKPNYMAAGHTEPDWLSKPDGDTLSVFYPYRARAERMEGAAAVNCTVTPEGVAMDCKVISERPAGYGFGNATIEIASFFRFRPATVYGVPVKGQVTIPLAWKL